MSQMWFNKNEHVQWRAYRYGYKKLEAWAQKWGNWLGCGNITTEQGDPVDQYHYRRTGYPPYLSYTPNLSELGLLEWQVDYQQVSPESAAKWHTGDPSCLTGDRIAYQQPERPYQLVSDKSMRANQQLYERVGFIRTEIVRLWVDEREAA